MPNWIELKKGDGKPEGLRFDAVVELLVKYTRRGETRYTSEFTYVIDARWKNSKFVAYRKVDQDQQFTDGRGKNWTLYSHKARTWPHFPTGLHIELLFDDGLIIPNTLANEVIWSQRGLVAYRVMDKTQTSSRLRIPKGLHPESKIQVTHKYGSITVSPAERTHGKWDIKESITDWNAEKR